VFRALLVLEVKGLQVLKVPKELKVYREVLDLKVQ
jgi:hypothetical protein